MIDGLGARLAAALTAVLPSDVIPGGVCLDAPFHTEAPYLQVGRVEPRGDDEASITLTVVGRADRATTQQQLARMRAALPTRLVGDGRAVVLRVVFADTFRASDWRRTYGVLRVIATAADPHDLQEASALAA